MKDLLHIAIEYQQLLKELPQNVAYNPNYREKRRELIRKKINRNDSLSCQEKRGDDDRNRETKPEGFHGKE